ncbi:MAG: hypothetical protein ACJ76V_08455, partial [Thermoleophilaceae bacterium]
MLRRACVLAVALALLPAASAAASPLPGPVDCTGPAGDAAPGTPEWTAREAREAYCGEQRAFDTAANPLFQERGAENTAADGGVSVGDPFRDPARLNGSRFRYEKLSFADPGGRQLDARLFRPCDSSCRDLPRGLRRFEPPYPAVVVVHGGGADQEMYWWGAESLA